MRDVFLTVLRMSLTGSLVILGVLLVRLALKKAPKRWTWALWLIVLFRLLTPFGIPLSVPVPDFSPVTEAARIDTESSSAAESPDSAVPSPGPADGGSSSEVYAPDPAGNLPSDYPSSPAEGAESLPAPSDPPVEADRPGPWDRVLTVAPFVWLMGAAVLTGWNLASYRSLKTRLSEAVPSGMRNVYLTDRVDSAFVVGLIRPKIYLPTGLTPVERACVAAHERTHIRRGDPWRRLLFFVALTVHWFNPLVWLAFSLSGKDMELSCDEAVLNRAMGRLDEQSDTSDADVRAAYAKTLVKFASRGRIGGPALAFGEGETGGRVKNVMKYKKPVLRVSVAAAAVLVLTGILLAVNVSARNTEIPHTRYTVGRIEYLYEQEQYEDVLEVLSRDLLMLTGEDRLYVSSLDAAVWSHMGRMEEWIISGEASGAGPGGIGGAEDLRDMLKESAGRDVGPIREARYRLTEPNHPNGSPYHLLLSTSDGRVWFAFVVRSDSDERGAAAALLLLKAGKPVPKGDLSFFELSLEPQVRETLPSVSGMDVKAFSADRGRDGIYTVLFAAGNSARTRFEDAGDDTPFSLGAAVFVPSEGGRGLRLAGWKLCPDAAVTGPLEELSASEELRPGTFRRENGNRILIETEDGETIRLELTLPERNRTLFGKTEYTGECSIRFAHSDVAEEAYEAPDFSAALPYTRYSADEVLYFYQDPPPEFLEVLESHRFEIAGDGSLWVNNWEETWTCIGKGALNPIMEDRSAEEWLLDQTGVDVGSVKESRLFSGQMNYGWILFSTEDGGFCAAMVFPGDEPDSLECRTLLRLRCEAEAENGAWIDAGYIGRSLSSAAEREVYVCSLNRIDPPGVLVVPFVAGLTWKDSDTMASWIPDRIPCHVGAAVFETSGQSVRLLRWSVDEDCTFTGWYPEKVDCELLSSAAVRYTLPDGTVLRAELTLPEKKTTFFGTQYTGACSIRFLPPEPADEALPSQPDETPEPAEEEQRADSLDQTREEIDAAYDAFLAEHYELEDMSSYLAAYATRRIDLNGDGRNELVVYRMPTESSYPLDIYEYHRPTGEVRAFHTTLEGIPASLNADPSGFWCAQIGAHDPDLPDGFYGDFFTMGEQTYLISMDASEFWKKLECHAFTTVSDSLAANTVFSAERCGAFYYDEAKQNRSFVNGQEIPFDGYFDALTDWRETWTERMGGSAEIRTQTPLWNESEVSGWPIVWYPPQGTGIEQMWCTPDNQPLFTLTFPAEWEQNVTIRTGGAWAGDPDNPVPLWIDFYDRFEQEKNGIGLLGSLALYRHAVDRFYPTRHEELMTLTAPDGESYDLVLVYPGDMQYWSYRDHYTYWQVRLKSVAARVRTAEGIRETIPPERAMRMLHDALVRAYENIYGPFEPLYADPTPEGAVGVEDSLWLRYVTTRLTLSDGRAVGAWEDEDFYWFPIIFPFAVDKRSGAVYKVYEGWDPAANEEYTQFTPFDPGDPNALAFAG